MSLFLDLLYLNHDSQLLWIILPAYLPHFVWTGWSTGECNRLVPQPSRLWMLAIGYWRRDPDVEPAVSGTVCCYCGELTWGTFFENSKKKITRKISQYLNFIIYLVVILLSCFVQVRICCCRYYLFWDRLIQWGPFQLVK